ncbi:adenosylcobinamide-GDP ribazoletransferase [Goodfellowiella coeruleoviolacea]|uniref:Adenosylcobinamide-GDP ribazoletransferase n=1 Tax=Goodfellowiella coeruleoviolacea TaxID=334858 RepID=A0AAE3KEF3_9PSEU|nr:adenosylcobinamide-GDP ribazoletransferase [Goodfellowiella coeruleoviolacea]MCP2165276.1 cobalamin-5'-phosphate synthase [Goodfellowiella coeruleoviolacea]
MGVRGLLLAVSWLTVLPVRVTGVDAAAGRWAIATSPLVGALLGGLAAAGLWLLGALGCAGLVAGLLVVGLLALATRGMHLDGLADTADGLGCYGPPERALAVMKDGGAGPFAVVTLVVVLGVQAASLGQLLEAHRLGVVVLALACGRAAFTWCCRRGVPAARPDGLGALVASSQPPAVPVLWAVGLAGAGVLAVPDRPWLAPAGVLLAAAVVVVFTWHARRRFGGITGDVLGGAAELAGTAVLVVGGLAG